MTRLSKDFGRRNPPRRMRISGATVQVVVTGSVGTVEVEDQSLVRFLLEMGWLVVGGAVEPGEVRRFRGHWRPYAHKRGDVVVHEGVEYQAVAPTADEPPSSSWERVSVAPGIPMVLHHGSGAPGPMFGLPGEYWLDTTGRGRLYGPRTSDGWGPGRVLGLPGVVVSMEFSVSPPPGTGTVICRGHMAVVLASGADPGERLEVVNGTDDQIQVSLQPGDGTTLDGQSAPAVTTLAPRSVCWAVRAEDGWWSVRPPQGPGKSAGR